MVFGTNALITKPAQSLAPMLTVAILNRYGYASLDFKSNMAAAPEMATMATVDLRWAMLTVCGATSVVMGIVQSVLWSFYTIRDSHNTISKYVES